MKNDYLQVPHADSEICNTYKYDGCARFMGDIQQSLFLWSLFLYPISILNHVIYLIPQFLLICFAFFSKKSFCFNDVLMFCVAIPACLIPFVIEFSSYYPNYDLAFKLFVNTSTIIFLAGNLQMVFTEKALKWIVRIVISWFFLVIFIYFNNGISGFSSLYLTFKSGSELNSSSLYGVAEPLRQLFLTKNISAMFVVSVFTLYLYISSGVGKKTGVLIFIIFMVVSSSFLSRQSMLATLCVYGFYRLIIANFFNKILILSISALSLFIFFLTFFDLTNSNDGASQRLELWGYFFDNINKFYLFGNGLTNLNSTLRTAIGIDNFHMFFMNQIGAYGIVHFIFFSMFLLFIFFRPGWTKGRMILVLGYLLNVCFQTYGYEYGNLFLFMAIFIKPCVADNARLNFNHHRMI